MNYTQQCFKSSNQRIKKNDKYLLNNLSSTAYFFLWLDGCFVPLVKKPARDWLESGSCPVGMAAGEQTGPCCLLSSQLFIACLCLHGSATLPPSPFTRARVNMPVQIAITQRQWQPCTPSLSFPSLPEPPHSTPPFRPRSLSEWESIQTQMNPRRTLRHENA